MPLKYNFYKIKPKSHQMKFLMNREVDNTSLSNYEEISEEDIRDVPDTSSSLDRSSIGSIPWADSSILENKLEWEKVEGMLDGTLTLSNEEDLKTEILDWQRKFP